VSVPSRLSPLVATLAALALSGCAVSSTFMGGQSLALESEGYRQVLKRWTKQHKVYRHFEAKIFVTATFLSPELRTAWIKRRTRLLGLPASEVRALEADHTDRDRRYHEFVVSIVTGEHRWNDFDSKDSMWRISLANDRHQEVAPVSVLRQDLRRGDLQAYFPYITVFQQAYIVRFPRTILELSTPILDAGVRSFSLRFLSGVAVAELTWPIDGVPTPP